MTAIGQSTLGVPRLNDHINAVNQLLERVLFKRHAVIGKDTFVGLRHLAHLADAEVGLHFYVVLLLVGVDFVVEDITLNAFGHAPALQEAAV